MPAMRKMPSMSSELAAALAGFAAAAEAGVTAEDARRTPDAFVRYVMQDERGRAVEVDEFTRLYIDCYEHCYATGRHLSIVTPPGTGKSSLGRILTCRKIGRNNQLRTVITSADVGDASNAVSLCRSIVLSQSFRDVFPHVEPDVERSTDSRGWKMGEWFLRTPGQRKDPTMQAVAEEPKGESIRVDILLADDIVTEKTCEGAVHERICNAFFKTWVEGRCSNGGWVLYQQNVRRKDDLAHRLRRNAKFTSVWVGVTEDCERLFVKVWNPPPRFPLPARPERYGAVEVPVDPADEPRADLQYEMPLPKRPGWSPERLRMIEPGAFLQMYRLIAADPSDLAFAHWKDRERRACTVAELLQVEEIAGMPTMTHMDRMRLTTVAGLDLSGTGRQGTAWCVLAVDDRGKIYPVEMERGAWSIGQMIARIDESWKRGIQPALIHVENNGVQDLIRQAIRDYGSTEWADRIVSFTTGSNKWNPQLGLPAVDVDFQQGTIVWPERESTRDLPHSKFWREFEVKMAQLTRAATRLTTPDEIMAFWFARDAARRCGPVGGHRKPTTLSLSNSGFVRGGRIEI